MAALSFCVLTKDTPTRDFCVISLSCNVLLARDFLRPAFFCADRFVALTTFFLFFLCAFFFIVQPKIESK